MITVSYITIKNLYKTFRNKINGHDTVVNVLENFNFDVEKGEFITVFGPNGCGKTTLLSIIAGLMEPDKGSIYIGDKKPKDVDVGLIFQDFSESLLPWRTVVENISFPLEIRGMTKKNAIEKSLKFVEELGLYSLKGFEKSYTYQLSSGLQQLVALARSLIYEPDVLLMDEPFGSIDFQTRLFLQDQLLEIWKKTNVTIILVSHEVNEAIYLGDKLILLSKKPAQIEDVIHNNLPTPRNHKVITSKEFMELKRKVLRVFSEEISL